MAKLNISMAQPEILATDTPDGQSDPSRLSEWITHAIPNCRPPLQYELIAAGGSNLTYRVTDTNGQQWALRRPPMAHTLATAHDMSREWRIMSALGANSQVPVPNCVAYCEDADLVGAPFYLMSFMEGKILRDQQSTKGMTTAEAQAATDSLIEVQIALHTLDLEEVGLADLGRHDNYVGRQLKRWRRQVAEGGSREVPLHAELHKRLTEAMPPEKEPPALAHGDYRFDNCVLDDNFKITAVLDWELCTTGNPVADFVWSLQYWGDPEDQMSFLTDPPTCNPAFIRRQEYCDQYAQRSNFDLSDLPYYQIFSWWKQASIVEGAYARRLAGAVGGMSPTNNVHEIATRVDQMLEIATDWAAEWL